MRLSGNDEGKAAASSFLIFGTPRSIPPHISTARYSIDEYPQLRDRNREP